LLFNFAILAVVFGNVFKVVGASKTIINMMKYVPGINARGGKTIPDDKVVGEIEFKNVSFNYPSKKDV